MGPSQAGLAWSGAEAREFDAWLQQELGLPAAHLMENAAAGLANSLLQISAEQGFTRILLLCGPGHNGGDGLTAARQLHGGGLDLRLALPLGLPKPGSLPAAALAVLDRLGLRPEPAGTPLADLLAGRELVVDALFGLGLDRPLEGSARDLIQGLNASRLPVLAVDLPSGLDATTGAVWGAAVRAGWTLSFVGPKQGFQRGEGPALTGQVRIAGIGVAAEFAEAWLRARRAAPNRES